MKLKIGSFNVLNLKLGSPKNGEFKNKKIEKIADIIRVNDLNIIALQEIHDDATVKALAELLGYEYCHCEDLYQELNEQNLQNKNGAKFKSEYAFLWNPRYIELDKDPEIYKGISEQISRRLDMLIGAIVAFIWTMLLVSRTSSEKAKKDEAKHVLGSLGLLSVISLLSYGAKEQIIKKMIEEVLHRALRPPLIGIFKKQNSNENKELRLINTHTQFAKSKDEECGTIEIRQKELGFVLGDVFDIVASQRDGKGRTPITLITGDYNLSLTHIEKIYRNPSFLKCHTLRNFRTVQEEKTTLCITNKDELEQGKPAKYEFCNDYDHFSFDQNLIGTPVAIVNRIGWTKEQFFIDERPISDHSPIQIEFQF